jgi:hypothetical protein
VKPLGCCVFCGLAVSGERREDGSFRPIFAHANPVCEEVAELLASHVAIDTILKEALLLGDSSGN